MTQAKPWLDLVFLLPGKDEQRLVDVLLTKRLESLHIRSIKYKTLVHPRRDPGCFREAPEHLRQFVHKAQYAVVIFDHVGSGQERRTPDDVARDLEDRLRHAGWESRCAVVLIVPELETWVWSDSPEVDTALGWHGRDPSLRQWLSERGLWNENEPKPTDPKRAVELALREAKIPRSSSIYASIARGVSLDRCRDPSFGELRRILRSWFGS